MKTLIVEDHPLFRDALAGVLRDLVPDATPLEAADARTAFEIIEREAGVALVLLDLALPGVDGVTTLQHLRQRYPEIAVVVVSAHSDSDRVNQVFDLGASGFIPKSSSNEVLKNALRMIIGGGVYIPPEILGRNPATASIPAPCYDGQQALNEIGLTSRQLQILELMLSGRSNKLIARELNLAEATVKNHITAILKALKVTTRTQAVLAVAKLGIVLPAARR